MLLNRALKWCTCLRYVCTATFCFWLSFIVLFASAWNHFFGQKLKASFTPSRHWGPRDPITHYYWMSRREELQRGDAPCADSARWQLGQLTRRSAAWEDTSDTRILPQEVKATGKLRSNSDDFFWTVYRRNEFRKLHENKRRSRSLDWRHIFTRSKTTKNTLVLSAFDIHSTNQTQREEIENAINAKADTHPEYTVQDTKDDDQ